MNMNKRDYTVVITNRMMMWFDVMQRGLNQSDRQKASRNLRRLIRKYPEIAARLGFKILAERFYVEFYEF